MKKKSIAGCDGLNQENFILGTNPGKPITSIIKKYIYTGTFPKEWKQAVVTPVLKKGNPEIVENYRPVSCLPVASTNKWLSLWYPINFYQTINMLSSSYSSNIKLNSSEFI